MQEMASGLAKIFTDQDARDDMTAAGGVPPLVALLGSHQPVVQQHAAVSLCRLAKDSQQGKNAIIVAGAVPPLVAMLSSDKPAMQEQAAGALSNLAEDSEQNRDAIFCCRCCAVPHCFVELRHTSSASKGSSCCVQSCQGLSACRASDAGIWIGTVTSHVVWGPRSAAHSYGKTFPGLRSRCKM